ncbi:hypothetical protein AC579_7150 [Pseudocercospora musae]|uniref:Uncharacterized protein n=1 Tax=Pseudocercospora musae TaxID=113226 RepID=A0A139INB1_9PEZI|nr:hypothetical protein AC579_7150 [Pseudocercospora musae]
MVLLEFGASDDEKYCEVLCETILVNLVGLMVRIRTEYSYLVTGVDVLCSFLTQFGETGCDRVCSKPVLLEKDLLASGDALWCSHKNGDRSSIDDTQQKEHDLQCSPATTTRTVTGRTTGIMLFITGERRYNKTPNKLSRLVMIAIELIVQSIGKARRSLRLKQFAK